MKLDIYQVDAFSCKSFGGNPLLLFLSRNGSMTQLCKISRWKIIFQRQLFLFPEDDGFHIRWFTPFQKWIYAVTRLSLRDM